MSKSKTMSDIPCRYCGKNPILMKIKGREREIDYCIAPFVKLLNDNGIITVASCCGHSRQPASIVLENGRGIRIFKNFEDAIKVDKLFPPIYD